MPPTNRSTFTRRAFLQKTTATTGLVALGHPLLAQEKPAAGFGLGFTLYGMKSLSLDDALKTCAEVGYDNVELCLLEGYPCEPKLLAPAARARLRERLASRKLH